MAIWLPRLATDRLRRDGSAPEGLFAVYAKIGNAFTLSAVDRLAERAGLAVDMPLADARAIAPDLVAFEADAGADARLLDHVAAWCERFTPIVVVAAPDALFLDVGGSSHLFGGEEMLRATVVARLKAQGFISRAAIAPNPSAAWACVRYGQKLVVQDADLRDVLKPLPVAALRLEDAAAGLLKRLGLKTIGQIMEGPREPFAARAGQQAMLRLDEALGRARPALSPRRPPPPVFAQRKLAEPIVTQEAILHVAEDLCADLCTKLERRGAGALKLRLVLFGVDAKTRVIALGMARPERDGKPILRLFRERLAALGETLDAEFGFEAVRLDACEIAPIVLNATDLAPASACDPDAEARLLDMLAARLGSSAVGTLAVRDTHLPEGASDSRRMHDLGPRIAAAPGPGSVQASRGAPEDDVMRRPLTLFTRAQPIEAIAAVPDGPPVRFRWRRVLREVVRAEGPERIAANWLQAGSQLTRDYYRLEDREGRRYWVYRDGLYHEAAAPQWFVHGVFA
ncbi:MAG: DNA polymerase Y family protein [Hyphomonadaceae bacterium]|nr:DNA polymerase Y family protein [Hyphomonadaceae bacterium]